MNRNALLACTLTFCFWSQMYSAKGLEVLVSSFSPPPATTNVFMQILPGQMLANQFSIYSPPAHPTVSNINQVHLLFQPNATAAQLSNIRISLNSESETVSSTGLVQHPGPVLQVPDAAQPSNMVDLTFSQAGSPIPVTIMGKSYLEVTYMIDTTSFQFPKATSKNYWLVVKNENLSSNVGWAKSNSTNPIYNSASTASINSDTMIYLNDKVGWQNDVGGNNMMLFSLVHAPEPSTYILGMIATGTLTLLARKARLRKLSQNNRLSTD